MQQSTECIHPLRLGRRCLMTRAPRLSRKSCKKERKRTSSCTCPSTMSLLTRFLRSIFAVDDVKTSILWYLLIGRIWGFWSAPSVLQLSDAEFSSLSSTIEHSFLPHHHRSTLISLRRTLLWATQLTPPGFLMAGSGLTLVPRPLKSMSCCRNSPICWHCYAHWANLRSDERVQIELTLFFLWS